MSKYVIFLLLADSALVAYRMIRRKESWRYIALYWVLLAVYNAFRVFEQ